MCFEILELRDLTRDKSQASLAKLSASFTQFVEKKVLQKILGKMRQSRYRVKKVKMQRVIF